jgi:membrane protein
MSSKKKRQEDLTAIDGHPQAARSRRTLMPAPPPLSKLPPPAPKKEREAWERALHPFFRGCWIVLLVAWRSCFDLIKHEGLELSGHVAFMSVLALFPFLIFLAALAGFLGQATSATTFADAVFAFVPPAVAATLVPVANDVLAHRSGNLLTFAIVFSLWTASSGIEALRVLLNRSYDVVETRALWRLRAQSMFIVVISAGVAFMLSFSIVLGPVIWQIMQRLPVAGLMSHEVWVVMRYASASVVTCIALIAIHRLLPNCLLRFQHIWPGALVTTALWLIGATLFSIYVDHFSQYSLVYGSLAGIMLTLFFFYLMSVILVLGAEVNAVLDDYRSQKRGTPRRRA